MKYLNDLGGNLRHLFLYNTRIMNNPKITSRIKL